MLGTVTALRRYPVKSMLGEDLDVSDVGRAGLARDRRLAVVSRRTGKVASAKYPRLWRDLLTLSAEALSAEALDEEALDTKALDRKALDKEATATPRAGSSGSRCPTARPSAAPTRMWTRSCPLCSTSPSR